MILRGQADVTVPRLAEGLRNKDASVRARSASALALIGPQASLAVPALTAALTDENIAVRTKAEEALKKIQSK